MSHSHQLKITRRDFLRLSGIALGGASLACGGGSKLVELTAIPTPENQAAPPVSALAPGSVPDTILVNGNIVTIDGKRTIAKALAVKNGIIMVVGDDQAVRKLADAGTKVIDLDGRTVTPGLIDAHCHLSACGLLGTAYVDVSWPTVFTVKDMQDKLSEKIAITPRGEWVLGSGWLTFEGRYPNKHDLDPISPNHPLFVINMGGHMAAVNSLALEMAGVNASTSDPGNGRFLREANNEPDGTIMNHPAMDYFRRLWPPDLMDLKANGKQHPEPASCFCGDGCNQLPGCLRRGMDRMQAFFNIAKPR